MGVYKVGSDGKAPVGLKVNDYVVTGGGTYLINGVNTDGSYSKQLHDPGQTTYNYTGKYDTPGQQNGTSQAQQVAQATSPASAAWGQTGLYQEYNNGNPNLKSGAINSDGTTYVTHSGQGQLSYDPGSGRIIRTMPNGSAWYVDPADAKYGALYQEYFNNTGQDPRGIFMGAAATGGGMMQSAAGSMSPYISDIQQLTNNLAGAVPPTYQPADTAAKQAALDQYLQQFGSLQYDPVDYNAYMKDVGGLDQYVQQALSALEPSYKAKYDQAYQQAAANMDRAGLFNSLYGQAFIAQQQNAITDALMAEAGTMGLDLQQQAREDAFRAYQAAVNERQFGASLRSDNLSKASGLTVDYINLLNDEAATQNDYNMQAYLSKMQQYVNAIDGLKAMGALTSAEYENMMTAAKIELSKAEAQLTGAQIANTEADTEKIKAQTAAIQAELAGLTAGGYGSGGGYYDYGGGGGIVLNENSGSKTKKADIVLPTLAQPSAKDISKEVDVLLTAGETQQAGRLIRENAGALTDAQLQAQYSKVVKAEAQMLKDKLNATVSKANSLTGGIH